jgi:hypothetical protein
MIDDSETSDREARLERLASAYEWQFGHKCPPLVGILGDGPSTQNGYKLIKNHGDLLPSDDSNPKDAGSTDLGDLTPSV